MKYLPVFLCILSSCSYKPVYHEIDTSFTKERNKAIIIFYVNGLSLDGEVPLYIDGVKVGIADKENYIRIPVNYGKHTFNTKCNMVVRMSHVCVAKQSEIEINKDVTYLTSTAKTYLATFIFSIYETDPVSQFFGLELF